MLTVEGRFGDFGEFWGQADRAAGPSPVDETRGLFDEK